METRLRKNPHLLFRWFPTTRPFGLVPFDESAEAGTLRSYLSSEKLPYYSRSEHLAAVPAPAGVDIPGEDALLGWLEGGEITGLVVTGAGGVGKTRLSLEIGRRAREKGWTVLRVRSRLQEDSLHALGERLTPAARVLLVIDYIETQRDFAVLVEILNDLNDTFHFNIRYVANCRTSYYQAVAATSRHRQVDISPHGLLRAEDWFEGYRSETVRHILAQSGLEVSEKHLSVCRDMPVLAVLLAYLHATGRGEQLRGLLEEEDFARWVAKRVQLSFPGAPIDRRLATLMALFPMPDALATQGALQEYRALLDPLATDGWIEKVALAAGLEGQVWATAHDVLADQIVLSYLRTIPLTVEHFAEELLTFAARAGCLRSALISLQRLADQPIYRAWLDAKGLLGPVRKGIEEWLKQNATTPEAGFVYSAWLDGNGELELVRNGIQEWLKQNARNPEASFLYRGWLNAGGERKPIVARMEDWLALHGRAADADFLFRAWLDAGGDFSLIREPALLWLSENYDKPEAVYLTKELAKQPDLPVDTVRHILAWCRKFNENENALQRLNGLGRHLLNREVAEDALSTSEAVLRPFLSARGPTAPFAKSRIAIVFSYLIGASGLRTGEPRCRVDTLLVKWLRNPRSYGPDRQLPFALPGPPYLVRVGKLLECGPLTLPSDRDALERFLQWVNTWQPSRKKTLRAALAWLKRHYPEPGLWEIVEIPEEPAEPEADPTEAGPR